MDFHPFAPPESESPRAPLYGLPGSAVRHFVIQ